MDASPSWMCVSCIQTLFPFNWIEEDDMFLKEVCGQMNCVNMNDLIIDNKEIFHVFDVTDDDDDQFVADIDPDKNYFNKYDFKLTKNCQYYDENQFNMEYAKNRDANSIIKASNPFSMCHINIRSVAKNLSSLSDYLVNLNHDFTFIGMSETWLIENTKELHPLEGYNTVSNCRPSKKGGGVSLYVKERLLYTVRHDLCIFNEHMESVFVEIDKSALSADKNVVIGVLYRPPNTDIEIFNEHLGNVLDKVGHEKKLSYIMGDYNINLLNYDSHTKTASFLDTLNSKSFIPLINRPTRAVENSHTIIDNIITNNFAELQCTMQGVLITDISDHYPVFSINWQIKEKCVNIVSWRRNMNARNVNRFKQLIAECEWYDIFTNLDTNTAFEKFHEKLKSAYDTAFPKIQIRKCYRTKKPWLTEALKTSIKTKNKLYLQYKKCNSVYNECKYKGYMNKLNKIIKATEKKYYQEKLEMNKTNTRKTWTIIKEVIGKNKATQVQTKFKLSSGEITSDKRTVCEKFNSFFVNIGPTLSKSFEGHKGSPDKYLRDRQIN